MIDFAWLFQDMNWLPNDPNQRMTILFLLFAAVLLLLMKLATPLIRKCRSDRRRQFWFMPLPAPNSLLRCRPRGELLGRLVTAALCTATLAVFYRAFWSFIAPAEIPTVVLSYLAAPVLLLFCPLVVAVLTLIWLPSGSLFPALHENPLRMSGVADFWGRRWNLWFSDWFRYALLAPLRRRPTFAVVAIFFVSGVMHEWVVNLPLYLATGRRLFGTMMLYFLLQAAGLLLERRWCAGRSVAKVALAWLVVFVPAPLVLNEGLLRALRLWPY